MKLFIADLKKIIKSPDILLIAKDKLKNNDKIRYESFSNQDRAMQFLVSRMIIEKYIAADYTTSDAGKICLKSGFVSVAHTKNLVVVASDNEPVGVDIEKITEERNFQKIAARMKFKNCDTAYDFFKSWTAYEADFKRDSSAKTGTYTYIDYQGFLICLSSNKSENIEIKHVSF